MNKTAARELLRKFDFKALFLNELGWDAHTGPLPLKMGEETITLEAVAEKRGMAAYLCPMPGPHSTYDYPTRCRIEAQLAKCVREHLIIYLDPARRFQTWQWVKREPGRPIARREHTYTAGQSGEALLQKLEALEIKIEEEDQLTLVGITARARQAFDVDRVTKRFYDRFKTEHAAFLKQIKGIDDEHECEWYASIMLNRLKFVYFIQKKGFLDQDKDYLRNRLAMVQKTRPKTKFLSFYRAFLLKLFHDGLGRRERSPELRELLGTVPYLNGGIFAVHPLEEKYGDIDIPDKAFEKVFSFFDQYRWHLDERPLRADDEINPDVLGYIFEKYINQKQMGAYYTKEDITEYIAKNCIVPFILDRVEADLKKKPDAFRALFNLLAADPDRYIYDPVKHGVALPLPPEIEKGVDTQKPKLLERRAGWNKPAPSEYALPTEIWREVVARRQRYAEVHARLEGRDGSPSRPKGGALGESAIPLSVNDLITLNLNIRQFAQDCIENAASPDVLWAFWKAIEDITVLDPTCGSGAFLFAAVNVLDPLYEACLDRMKAFMLEWSQAQKVPHPNFYKDFAAVIARVDKHANEKYFIFKSIIIRNLYGVDIMDEAVEICKLRLFLKLAAQIEPDYSQDNLGIEPLPDIDFNIRAGNTLVGYTTAAEVRRAFKEESDGQGKLMLGDLSEAYKRFEEQVELTDRAFQKFREMQTEHGMDASDFRDAKGELRRRLAVLDDELSRYMAKDYGVEVEPLVSAAPKKEAVEPHACVAEPRQSYRVRRGNAYQNWLRTHQPFHWFVHFYGIMTGGGFDAIIGNPPYIELSDITGKYTIKGLNLAETGNLYALCIERFSMLTRRAGRCGVIVPISSVSTPRMFALMQHMHTIFSPLHLSHFAVRPGKLFNGVDMNLTIVLGKATTPGNQHGIWSTRYNRWNEEARHVLFPSLAYAPSEISEDLQCIPKIGNAGEAMLFTLLRKQPPLSRVATSSMGEELYYHSGGRYFRKCLRQPLSNEYKRLVVPKGMGPAVLCLLTSSLYYWYWLTISDCYHVTKRDVSGLPLSPGIADDKTFVRLAAALLKDLNSNATRRVRSRASGEEQVEINFHVARSKSILDEIDVALARHYGMRPDQTDLVVSNDAKYRVRDEDE